MCSAGKLKLGSNKSSPQVRPGGIVLLELGGKPPQLGVVLSMTQRDVRVRLRQGETSLALGQCVPITPADRMWGTRQGETFTHFISLEYKQDETFKNFQKKVTDLQEKMAEIEGIGKTSKPESLHLTIATLNAVEEEVPGLLIKTNDIFKKYSDILSSPCGLSTTYTKASVSETMEQSGLR